MRCHPYCAIDHSTVAKIRCTSHSKISAHHRHAKFLHVGFVHGRWDGLCRYYGAAAQALNSCSIMSKIACSGMYRLLP